MILSGMSGILLRNASSVNTYITHTVKPISRTLFQDVFVIFTSGWRPHRSNYSTDEHLGFESSPWNRRRIERKVNTQKFLWDLNWTTFTCCCLPVR